MAAYPNALPAMIRACLLALVLVAPQSAQALDGENVVVATVNGTNIYKNDADRAFNEYMQKAGKQTISAEEKEEIVHNMIRRQLILHLPEVQRYKQDETVMRQVREFENNLIVRRYLEKTVGRAKVVADGDLRTFYEANRSQFAIPPKVEARHILTRTRSQAEKVLALLKQGDDFSGLARQYSIDLPMALEGGGMGTIEKGKTLPALEHVLFTLQEGQHSDVVQTPFGYHVVTVDKLHPAGFRTFDEVKEQIRTMLTRRHEAEAFKNMALELEKQSDAKIYSERF